MLLESRDRTFLTENSCLCSDYATLTNFHVNMVFFMNCYPNSLLYFNTPLFKGCWFVNLVVSHSRSAHIFYWYWLFSYFYQAFSSLVTVFFIVLACQMKASVVSCLSLFRFFLAVEMWSSCLFVLVGYYTKLTFCLGRSQWDYHWK